MNVLFLYLNFKSGTAAKKYLSTTWARGKKRFSAVNPVKLKNPVRDEIFALSTRGWLSLKGLTLALKQITNLFYFG